MLAPGDIACGLRRPLHGIFDEAGWVLGLSDGQVRE